MSGAVRFHEKTAEEFLAQYQSDRDFVERFEAWTAVLAPLMRPETTVLDLGCGGGTLATWAALDGARVTAVDGSASMIAAAKKSSTGTEGTPTFLEKILPSDIPGAPFDVVYASSLLEYMEDAVATDEWVASQVKAGGTLAFSLPNRQSVYRVWERLQFAVTRRPAYLAHVQRWSTPCATLDRFAALGFSIAQVRYYGHRPMLCRLLRNFLPARFTENLFLVVLKKT